MKKTIGAILLVIGVLCCIYALIFAIITGTRLFMGFDYWGIIAPILLEAIRVKNTIGGTILGASLVLSGTMLLNSGYWKKAYK